MGAEVRLEAIAQRGRYAGLEAVQRALSEAGGFLIDAQLYSDLYACLRFELPGEAGERLAVALADLGVPLDGASNAQLLARRQDAEIEGTLAVSFPGATGALRHERPAVPG